MDTDQFKQLFADLPLGDIYYFDQIGSTNDYALARASEGITDFSLIFADEQTAGRGRGSRQWFTPPGAALAFSLVLKPNKKEEERVSIFSGLAALALVSVMDEKFEGPALIKWPNDVLLTGRKVAGILVESVWLGDQPESVVVGVGVNVSQAAVPPDDRVNFPATSIEQATGLKINRFKLLHEILENLVFWRQRMHTEEFILSWEKSLAFKGEWVHIWQEDTDPRIGKVLGLMNDGGLRLESQQGDEFIVKYGEVTLRPVD